MRTAAPVDLPVALTIAGSDSGGGAGVQADLQTMAAHDVFGTSVVTAVTAQNTCGVTDSHVLPVEQVQAQADAVLTDFDVGALKTGMLATAPIVEAVTERVASTAVPAVVDPVMVATSGDRLLAPEAEAAYEELIAEATVVTPNADEAAVLTDVEPASVEEQREAAEALVEAGADAALVKGGHVDDDPVRDVLVTASGTSTFEHPRIDTDATHGSGCSLSAAIAAHLAQGREVEAAVEAATEYMERAVRYSYDVGEGPGAVNHLVGLRDRAAREPTAEAVHDVVAALVDANADPIVAEVGTNVVGSTPAAESLDDVAAAEGRLTRTVGGLRSEPSVRFGASKNVASALLGAREVDADLRFGLHTRLDDAVDTALEDLGWEIVTATPGTPTAGETPATEDGETAGFEHGGTATNEDAEGVENGEIDGGDGSDEDETGRRNVVDAAILAATRRGVERADETPTAVRFESELGFEPGCLLLASSADELTERTLALLEQCRDDAS